MFTNSLKYYHGTSLKRWEKIQSENQFIPSHIKNIGAYWITKGVYFVCENPYIALWYAHVAALKDKSKPIVLCIEYAAGKKNKSEILNLLTSDGHKVLAIAHNLFKKKLENNHDHSYFGMDVNLDSVSLQLLMNNSRSLKAVIACFQEGKSYQNMIFEHKYKNQYVLEQRGFSPGDHIEICFYPDLKLDDLNIKPLEKNDILDNSDPKCQIWDYVCAGLTEPLDESKFKKALRKSLTN
jgi:hypothetical protein